MPGFTSGNSAVSLSSSDFANRITRLNCKIIWTTDSQYWNESTFNHFESRLETLCHSKIIGKRSKAPLSLMNASDFTCSLRIYSVVGHDSDCALPSIWRKLKHHLFEFLDLIAHPCCVFEFKIGGMLVHFSFQLPKFPRDLRFVLEIDFNW